MGPPRPRGTEKNKHTVDSKHKKQRPRPKENEAQSSSLKSRQGIPLELQQLLLNIFKTSFSTLLSTDILPLLQEIKGHLYSRDFLAAFGRNDYLEAYAARWSPSRVLGFLQMFVDLQPHILPALEEEESENRPGVETGNETRVSKKVVCLGGGGGAEIAAWSGFLSILQNNDITAGKLKSLEVVTIDIANWASVIETLYTGITTAPPISKYASAAAQAVNVRLVDPESFVVKPYQLDILNTDFSVMAPLLQDASLITIMFTLNELYSTSLLLTQKFLLQLTACVQAGALLLVGDSPGSYSTVSIDADNTEKKYPMQWLLDHTLLRLGTKGEESKWSKVEEDESRWFRLREELKYPIELESMRFQMHLYRRVG